MLPSKGGFAVARIAPSCRASTESLMDQPGAHIYNFFTQHLENEYRYASISISHPGHTDYCGFKYQHLKMQSDQFVCRRL